MADLYLDDLYWNVRNETNETVTLYGSQGTPFEFPPGAIFVPPKQVEALNAVRVHKATLLEGGVGGGKSVAAEMCMNDFLFDLSTPGHVHGLDPMPCMIAHERLYAFLIGQTLVDIRRRNLPHWMERYGEFGTLNKNNWEFTYHEEYGSHVVVMVGTDDPKKLRGTMASFAFHDECTLDTDFRNTFWITLSRLRQAGIPHTPWIGCTNTTGPSREEVKELFLEQPRPATRDEKTGKLMPGYTHIHSTIYDNPYMDRSVTFEMEQGTEFEVKAYVHGSWDKIEGARYELIAGVHIVEDYEILETWPMWVALDMGWGHPTVFESMRQNPASGRWVIDRVWSEPKYTAMNAKFEIWNYWLESGAPISNAVAGVIDISAKRGESKLKASGFANSTDYHIFNSDTQHGSVWLPSFRLKPAYKSRVEGWKMLDELFACQWEWRPERESEPLSSNNRIAYVIEPPKLEIFRSCSPTVSSFSLLQADPKIDGDAIKTTGNYGPGRGDDEAEDTRYVAMLACKRKIGGMKHSEDEELLDGFGRAVRTRDPARFGQRRGFGRNQRGSVWA